jgi:hypothetical protein
MDVAEAVFLEYKIEFENISLSKCITMVHAVWKR